MTAYNNFSWKDSIAERFKKMLKLRPDRSEFKSPFNPEAYWVTSGNHYFNSLSQERKANGQTSFQFKALSSEEFLCKS